MIFYEVVNSFVEWCGNHYFHSNIQGMVINQLFFHRHKQIFDYVWNSQRALRTADITDVNTIISENILPSVNCKVLCELTYLFE